MLLIQKEVSFRDPLTGNARGIFGERLIRRVHGVAWSRDEAGSRSHRARHARA
jgi:hypothetical protein